MSDSQSALNEVPALLEERRRYESWLAALAARRESTPLHVFERVQADYRARLERVAEQLASHRQAIEEERGNLQSRVSVLQAEEALRRDERAELELRAHVGELVGTEAESAFGTVDHSIGQLVDERQGLEARVAELTALITDEEPAKPEPEASEPVAESPASVDDSVSVAPHSAEVSTPEPVVAEEPVPDEEPATVGATQASDVPVAVEQAVEPAHPAAAPSTAPSAKPDAKPDARPDVAASAAGSGAQPDGQRPRGARGSFDELAFLSSVVGKNDGGSQAARKEVATAMPKPEAPLVERRSSEPLLRAPVGVVQEENAASESLLAGVENAKHATGEHPLAANVAANTPIVLRPSTTLEQAKTLKCNECGGLNYPTEWYCERCGAELAAL